MNTKEEEELGRKEDTSDFLRMSVPPGPTQ